MEDTVKNKNAHLVIEAAAKAARVPFCHGWGDRDIADILRRVICGSGVKKVVFSHAAIFCAPLRGFASIRCKRQYIGRAAFATICAVPAGDLGVSYQANCQRVLRQAQPAPSTSEEFVKGA